MSALNSTIHILYSWIFRRERSSLCIAPVYCTRSSTAWEAAAIKTLSTDISLLWRSMILSLCAALVQTGIQLTLLLHPLISNFCPSSLSSGSSRAIVLESDWERKKYSLNPRSRKIFWAATQVFLKLMFRLLSLEPELHLNDPYLDHCSYIRGL